MKKEKWAFIAVGAMKFVPLKNFLIVIDTGIGKEQIAI